MIELTIGRALWSAVRDALETARFAGYEFEWREGSGFLRRTFMLKGRDAQAVAARIVGDNPGEFGGGSSYPSYP